MSFFSVAPIKVHFNPYPTEFLPKGFTGEVNLTEKVGETEVVQNADKVIKALKTHLNKPTEFLDHNGKPSKSEATYSVKVRLVPPAKGIPETVVYFAKGFTHLYLPLFHLTANGTPPAEEPAEMVTPPTAPNGSPAAAAQAKTDVEVKV